MTDRRNSGQGVGDSQQGAVGRKPLEPNEGRIGYPIVKTIIPQALVSPRNFNKYGKKPPRRDPAAVF